MSHLRTALRHDGHAPHLAVALAALVLACSEAPQPAAREVLCDAGGRCRTPVEAQLALVERVAALPSLASGAGAPGVTRDVRIWTVHVPSGPGRLLRFVADSAGDLTQAEYVWWQAADTRAAWFRDESCDAEDAARWTGRGIVVCRVDAIGPPYARNRLRVLEGLGLDTLRGDGTPPDTTPCCGHVIVPPYRVVVESWTPARYRTYGGAGPRSSSHWRSDDELQAHARLTHRHW